MFFTWRAILDILLVAVGLCFLCRTILRLGTWKIVSGTFIAILLFAAANLLDLKLIEWIYSNVSHVAVIALIVIFQPEIRKILLSLGTNRLVRLLTKYEKVSPIDEVVKGVSRLAERGLGGLLCLERETGLKEYIETGTRLDAKITTDLISTIFTPDSALHDGAIIIRESKIVSAGSILPISKNPEIPPELGMRHRAAVGITEETDAICIAVSEETKKVSLAMEGRLIDDLDPFHLKVTLEAALAR